MSTTNYIWDEQNYLAESDGTNTINVVYTNEPRSYGNLVSARAGSTSLFHHFDVLGSTRQISTNTGFASDAVIFDAWGNVANRTGSSAVVLLWIGEVGYYYDVETGLFSVRERPYDPSRARWSAPDPVATITAGTYIYAANTPLSVRDASGLQPDSCPIPGYEPPFPCIPGLTNVVCSAIPNWTPESCTEYDKPCACSDTMSGKGDTNNDTAQAIFDEARAAFSGVKCKVMFRTGTPRSPCVPAAPKYAVTCADPNPTSSTIFICIPAATDPCNFRARMFHEMKHAQQFCEGIVTADRRIQNEKAAYALQCETLALQQCLQKGTNAFNMDVEQCKRDARGLSHDPNKIDVSKFDEACQRVNPKDYR